MDDFFRQHAGAFDGEEPEPGHIDRFRAKLGVARERKLRTWILRVAAVVLLGMVVTYLAFREWDMMQETLASSGSEFTSPELQEAEKYYHLQLSRQYIKMQNLKFYNNKDEKKALLDEFSVIDTQVQDMMRDLRQNPDDERIVNAIFNFYQLKIETMDRIIALAQQQNSTIL
jgi:hypothetical protein